MSRTTFVISLLMALALPLAGCIGDQGTTGQPAGPTSDDQPTAEPQDGDKQDGPAGTQSPPEEDQVETTTPVDWEGNLGTWACAPMGPNACAGTSLGDQDSWHPVDPEGDGRSLELTLTWQAISPLTEELSLTVAPYTSCGDGCYGTAQPYATVTGASPVEIELHDIGLEGEQLGYLVYVDGPLWIHEDPVLFGASHHQPFHVEGTLTTLVPAS